MRGLLVSGACVGMLLLGGMGTAAAGTAGQEAFGPPPACEPRDQWRQVGFEIESWTYLRTQGAKLFFDYRFNQLSYGEVSCTR